MGPSIQHLISQELSTVHPAQNSPVMYSTRLSLYQKLFESPGMDRLSRIRCDDGLSMGRRRRRRSPRGRSRRRNRLAPVLSSLGRYDQSATVVRRVPDEAAMGEEEDAEVS